MKRTRIKPISDEGKAYRLYRMAQIGEGRRGATYQRQQCLLESVKRCIQARQDESLLRANNHYRPWSSCEVDYLRTFAPIKSGIELAIDLGRTYHAIRNRTNLLGIRLRKWREMPWHTRKSQRIPI